MNTEAYDALRAINVPEEHARRAAEALTKDVELALLGAEVSRARLEVSGRVTELHVRIAALQTHVDERFSLLQWMVGFNLALNVAILWKIFGH